MSAAEESAAEQRRKTAISMRQSNRARECMSCDEPPATLNSDGRPATRTMMVEARRQIAATEAAAKSLNQKLSLPVGVLPGAPGKQPDYKRFTKNDVLINKALSRR